MDADKNHSGECARTAEREETLSWAAARRHSIMEGGGVVPCSQPLGPHCPFLLGSSGT